MPRLRAEKHVSLVPGLGRRQAEALREQSVHTWVDLGAMSDEALGGVGLDDFAIRRVRAALVNLAQSQPTLREELRSDALDDLSVVAAEIPDLAEARRSGGRLRPTAIYYESDGQIDCINVPADGAADLSRLINQGRLAGFGGTDLSILADLAREAGLRLPRALDVLTLVEGFVHAPLAGLDLESLAAGASSLPANGYIRRGADRVRAIRSVIDWVRQAI
jgi:hypothetical protein